MSSEPYWVSAHLWLKAYEEYVQDEMDKIAADQRQRDRAWDEDRTRKHIRRPRGARPIRPGDIILGGVSLATEER